MGAARRTPLLATPNQFRLTALKAAIADYDGDLEWNRVRPPLVELNQTQRAALIGALREAGFQMPGLGL